MVPPAGHTPLLATSPCSHLVKVELAGGPLLNALLNSALGVGGERGGAGRGMEMVGVQGLEARRMEGTVQEGILNSALSGWGARGGQR